MSNETDMMKASQFIDEIRYSIQFAWNKRDLARDKDGKPVNPISPEATSRSLLGAMMDEAHTWSEAITSEVEVQARKFIYDAIKESDTGVGVKFHDPLSDMIYFNDHPKVEEDHVIDVLSKASHKAYKAEQAKAAEMIGHYFYD